jgi:cytoskeletal protein CcmA (bactofilin family)
MLAAWIMAGAMVTTDPVEAARAEEPPAPPAAPAAPAIPAAPAPPDVPEPPAPPRGPTFVSGQDIDIDEPANDVFAFGQSIDVTGGVSDNSFIAGQEITVAGKPLGGDAFLAGETVVIDTTIRGDVYAFAQSLELRPNGHVEGALTVFAERAELAGRVDGRVDARVARLELLGDFRDDVTAQCGGIEVGPEAKVAGDLSYQSAEDAAIPPTASILGAIDRTEPAPEVASDDDEEDDEEDTLGGTIASVAIRLTCGFLIGSLLLWAAGAGMRRTAIALALQPAQALGAGLLVLFVTPVVALLLIIPLVTIPITILGLLAWLVAIYVGILVAAHGLGLLMLRPLVAGRAPSPYLALLAGLVMYHVATAVPYVGGVAKLAVIVAGLGGLTLALLGRGRLSPPAPPLPANGNGQVLATA